MTVPAQTWPAGYIVGQHCVAVTIRAGARRIGRTEQRDNRRADSSRNMHRSGVVRDQRYGLLQQAWKKSYRSLSCEINRLGVHLAHHASCILTLQHPANEDNGPQSVL